ncbi:CDP-diacylglycerol--glycerol-3-phosphate 3-phosphatidyltransferase [Hyphococcus luteus]|jgi:CDP-diacylglycerol--glycerol-3-phosphate 3-phosphatidyltransferase|uniref:CDP-diacylglycerol--glycerol-3-phosphate 3-phosphatidyltransferase n=1 Tax=Hyphococcus luteus TaxID=2058213 RepID=A0A2S7K0W8_9PROT|nr:CDP-diacylglycerol--glycerol-3-phosphate 3-phosphatidyltransferase [Marinicaulis flavus]PQA86160.1 CDP-diacylglycerol--glycerol-3-phosphate 3-phosphatidyltransferase [Marinicaulis flavus]
MANLITLARMALVIPFVFVFLANAPWNMTVALIIFVIASLSDFLDGYVARARGETSALGAALDPIADKLLIAAALILLVRNGTVVGVGVVAVIIIILREILVSGLREALSAKAVSLPVTALAKWKTTAQLVAAGLLLAAAHTGIIGPPLRPAASAFLWIAAVLTFWTGAEYALRAMTELRTKQN